MSVLDSITGCTKKEHLVKWAPTYLCMTVEHDLNVVTVAHAQLLAKDGNLTVATVSDEDRALCRSDHDLRVLTLVDEALSDMLVHVQLTIVTVINCKIFPVKLTGGPVQKLGLLLREEQLSVSGLLGSPVLGVPRVLSSGCGSRLFSCLDQAYLALLLRIPLIVDYDDVAAASLVIFVHLVLASSSFLLDRGVLSLTTFQFIQAISHFFLNLNLN